jgi:endonuclease/exonuclease/phosphatase family metal-dependent hydrolase
MKYILLALPLLLSLSAKAKTLKVMEYNVENFFDTKFDEGTSDYTYLPLAVKRTLPGHAQACKGMGNDRFVQECLKLDWTDAKFAKKAMNVAKAIKAYDDTGKGPDIIIVEEVENLNVLNSIVAKGLANLGYVTKVLIEGDDTRGIDVGVISKFPVISAKRYPIVHNGVKLDTRGILEVFLNVSGKKVVVYANHWPSQSNPAAQRVTSAKVLADLAEKASADLVIAAGDFNTIDSDSPNPFAVLKNFEDAEGEARRLGVPMHGGTHYYLGEWKSLDHIFIHKKSSIKVDLNTFQIMNRDFLLKKAGREMVPYRANAQTGEGFSDHLPMGVEFNY